MSIESQLEELTAAMRALNDNLYAVLHQQPVVEPEPEAVVEPEPVVAMTVVDHVSFTREQVIDALRDLQGVQDAHAVKALLKQFGATDISSLSEDKYEDIIEAAGGAA